MKNSVVLAFVLMCFFVKAQETKTVAVEKNLNSIQLGLISLSFQNETRLARTVTLRSEIGLAAGTSTITYYSGNKETSFLVLPFVNVEPRWYYSLDRRSRLNKSTERNSSNYVSLLNTFVSSRTALVNTKDFEIAPSISVIPEYGFRRKVGKSFFWECSAGIGYKHNFLDKSYTYSVDANEVVFNFQYKVGYVF
jgi:hypothetical protein